MNVLLIEDSVFYQKIFINFFEKYGVEYEVCEHGCYALEVLSEKNFDYVFLDLKLPDMNGKSIYNEHLCLTDSVVIPITGYQEEISNTISTFNQYLLKPFGEDELAACLGFEKTHEASEEMALVEDSQSKKILMELCETMGYRLSNQLLDSFQDVLDNKIPQLHRLYSQGHLYEVESAMHQIKSSARYFGFMKFASVCEDIELQVLSGSCPSIPNQIDILLDMTDDMSQILRWARIKVDEFKNKTANS